MELWQMESSSLMIVRAVMLLFIIQQTVNGHYINRQELHVCNNAGQEIILNCTSSQMILVESAVVGVSDGWRPGLINCPRDNDNCVKQIQQPHEKCNYKPNCSLPLNTTMNDIGNGCDQTNYIHIIYACLPVDVGHKSICSSVDQSVANSIYLASPGYPKPMTPFDGRCQCYWDGNRNPNVTITSAIKVYKGFGTDCIEKLRITEMQGNTQIGIFNTCHSNVDAHGIVSILMNLTVRGNNKVYITYENTMDQIPTPSIILLNIQVDKPITLKCCGSDIICSVTNFTTTTHTTSFPETTSDNIGGVLTYSQTSHPTSSFSEETHDATAVSTTGLQDDKTESPLQKTSSGIQQDDLQPGACSSVCIAGIIVAFAVVVALVVVIVYMYRRKMKNRPKKGSPSDVVNPDGTEIIDNTTYSTTITDNHSDRIINTNKNMMLPGPVIVSSPDYWDGDIKASESVKPKTNHEYLDIVGTLPAKSSNNDKLSNYEEVGEATFEANTGKNMSQVPHMKGPDGDYYALPDKGTGALAGEAGMSDGTTKPSNGVVHVKGPAGDYYALPAKEPGIAGVGDPYSLAGDSYVYSGGGVEMNDGDTELVDNAMYGTQ